MIDTGVTIAGVRLKNPVMTASGTFGSGREFSEFFDLSRLGAIVVKGVSEFEWKGNAPSRIAETHGGMLNAVGLQNPGARVFLRDDLPFLRKFDTKIIVNICGHTIDEYIGVTKAMRGADIDMLELNISCPNVAQGGITFGTDAKLVEHVVGEVKKNADKPLIVKLTPNVTDITEIAKAAEHAGADALSMINTLSGMKIDIHKRAAVLANKIGGLSGPAIKPVAVRAVWQAARAVKIPIIGMGGIANGDDAIEFIMAGAAAVAVGTAVFSNVYAPVDVAEGIVEYMKKYNIENLSEIRGIVK